MTLSFRKVTAPVKISYEVFPGKDTSATGQAARTIDLLAPRRPAGVSVTYGAGGSTTGPSQATVKYAVKNAGCPVAAHVTCVGQSKETVLQAAEQFLQLGVAKFVALRGDPPEGISAPYYPHDSGFKSTADFVSSLAELMQQNQLPVDIAVSGYPEVHPQSASLEHDLRLLEAKVNAGATSITTQFCFDAARILRYRDAVCAAGVDIPITVGLVVPFPASRVLSMASKCAASAPESLLEVLEADNQLEAATGFVANLASRLLAEGVDRFHVYTLNQPAITAEVFTSLHAARTLQRLDCRASG